jgi:tetratricopeptide (TPR) repeat protein
MGFDRPRVVEIFAKPTNAPGRIGSGYRVSERLVLTAAHVVAGLPVGLGAASGQHDPAGRCDVRPLGVPDWSGGSVIWRDKDTDVALIGLAGGAPLVPAASPGPRWGRMEGAEPVAVTAVGFPWAQQRPDRVRDSEQVFGFIAPATTVKAGLCAVTVLTAAPAERTGGSPWAGMSGAALFAGPFLVGVVIIDPSRFGTDRVVAVPVAPLFGDGQFAGLLEVNTGAVVGVGPRFRLAVTAETSVALSAPYRAATPRLGRDPARLLLPEYGIVPFAGRDSDLAMVQEWCQSGAGPAVRLVIGAGGAGKTRLAAEACVRMATRGWQAGFADPEAPGGQAQLEFDRPTLLAVDDADLKVPLLAGLIQVLGYWPADAPPVRLLLLARHTTWWEALNQRTGQLAAELADPPLLLGDGDLSLAERGDQHARALAAFAAHLAGAVSPAGHGPPLQLADPAFASPLLVHMHALLTASGADTPTTGTAVREQILAAVLGREQDRWAATFPAGVPTSGARARHQAVTAMTLFAPPDEPAAAQTMTVIAELAPEAAAGPRAAVATWLRQLYPGSDPPWVAPMRPDLLAEQLLATCPQLPDLVLTGYGHISGPGQLEQLLTELTRAQARAMVHAALDQLLTAQLPAMVTAAADAPAGLLPDLLDLALTCCPQPATAAALADQLPERSTGLAALAVTITSQAVQYLRQRAAAQPDAFTLDLAASLNDLSLALAAVGRREEALAAIQEAADLYRELTAAWPDAFTPNLAGVLTNLSLALGELGRWEEALAAIEEAVTVCRGLAATWPDAFTPDLAASLTNLSNALGELGRWEEALAAIQEAADLCRGLAAARPDAFTPNLAGVLNNLSNRLADLGQWEEALAAIQEAADLDRGLAAARPDAFTPDLATSLIASAAILTGLGRDDEALTADREALVLYRTLNAAYPRVFRNNLINVLQNFVICLRNVNLDDEAEQAERELRTLTDQSENMADGTE